jgi:adenosylhomocysteine nucleosidase
MHSRRFFLLASHIWQTKGSALVLCTLLILFLAGCAPQAVQAPASSPQVDILVQGAELTELGPLISALENRRETAIASWYFWEGSISGKRVVVSLTEVGPMNASVATTLAIERWKPRVILNQGTSGAHDPHLKVHDIVLGVRNVEFGAFKMAPAGRGQGVSLKRIQPTTTKLRLGRLDNRVPFREFPGSMDIATQALRLKYDHGKVLVGAVGSAHQWNRELDRLDWLRQTYGTDTEDMESAYVAAVAYAFKIPFLSIRIVSDNEYHGAEFVRETGTACSAFVLNLIRHLDLDAIGPVEHLSEHAFPPAQPGSEAESPVAASSP